MLVYVEQYYLFQKVKRIRMYNNEGVSMRKKSLLNQVKEDIEEKYGVDLSQYDLVLKIEDRARYDPDRRIIFSIINKLRKHFGGPETCVIYTCGNKQDTFLCYRKKQQSKNKK